MRYILKFAVFIVTLLMVGAVPAMASENGSRDEAKAMSVKAAHYFMSKGQEAAFAAFNEGSNGFKDRDLYVFVYDPSGVCVAHGANKALIGKNLLALRDVDGKELIKEIVSTASEAWVAFKWANPQTKAIEQKYAYVVRQGGYFFGVGAYEKK